MNGHPPPGHATNGTAIEQAMASMFIDAARTPWWASGAARR
jgi:hypothetical protein